MSCHEGKPCYTSAVDNDSYWEHQSNNNHDLQIILVKIWYSPLMWINGGISTSIDASLLETWNLVTLSLTNIPLHKLESWWDINILTWTLTSVGIDHSWNLMIQLHHPLQQQDNHDNACLERSKEVAPLSWALSSSITWWFRTNKMAFQCRSW